jgi:hypothetical protein
VVKNIGKIFNFFRIDPRGRKKGEFTWRLKELCLPAAPPRGSRSRPDHVAKKPPFCNVFIIFQITYKSCILVKFLPLFMDRRVQLLLFKENS